MSNIQYFNDFSFIFTTRRTVPIERPHKEWTLQTVVVSYVMDESIAMWKYVFLWDFEEESISLHCEI